MTTTPKWLEEIKSRAEQATPGPLKTAREIAVNIILLTRIDIWDILVADIEAALLEYGDARADDALEGALDCTVLGAWETRDRIRALKSKAKETG